MKKFILGLSTLVSLSGCDAIRDYTNKTLQEADSIEVTVTDQTPAELCSDDNTIKSVFNIIYNAAAEEDVRFDRSLYGGSVNYITLKSHDEVTDKTECETSLSFNEIKGVFPIVYSVQEDLNDHNQVIMINEGFDHAWSSLSSHQRYWAYFNSKLNKFENLILLAEEDSNPLLFENEMNEYIKAGFVPVDTKHYKALQRPGYDENILRNNVSYLVYETSEMYVLFEGPGFKTYVYSKGDLNAS